MRVHVLTTLAFILTQRCYCASDANEGDTIEQSDSRSSKFGTEPFGLGSPHIQNGRVRFEENPPKASDNLHFFPEEHNNESDEERHDQEVPLYSDSEVQNNLTRDTYTNGRVVFEDDGKRKDREPTKKRKRKLRGRPDNRLQVSANAHNGLDYSGYPSYGSQHFTSYTNAKRPRYYPATGSYQNYGLHPGFPSLATKPALNTGPQQYASQGYAAADLSQTSGRPGIHNRPEFAGAYPGYFPQAGQPVPGGYGYVADSNSQYGQPGLYSGYAGPNRHPQSLTQQAVSAVTEALTSVALFDDKQCVPRILCEVASGRVAGSSTMLKATAGLGPLLGMLQAYNGVSSSPLFIFGRAAVLGVTSVGSTIACHRAYPQCPNDPTELINYLNNHNGGFFRFFGQPTRPQKQQNLEEFYNHLAGQGNPLHSYANTYSNGYPHQYQKSKLLYNENESEMNTSSKVLDIETSSSEIQERIQNKPGIDIFDAEDGSKWTFPEETDASNNGRKPRRPRTHNYANPTPERGDNPLKFPNDRGPTENRDYIDRNKDFIRTQKLIFFSNGNNLDSQYNNYQTNNALNLGDYVFDNKYGFYVRRPKGITHNVVRTDDADIVYILRGNADPNHPEIVRVKPGQSF